MLFTCSVSLNATDCFNHSIKGQFVLKRPVYLFVKTESKGPRTIMLSPAPTYTYSIIVRGPLLSVFTFSFIWTVGLFRSDMLYIFTWFCPCFQCKNSFAYPHFPYRDSDMIFRILCLLSHSHAFRVAVFDWQAFEFEPIRIVITTSTEAS